MLIYKPFVTKHAITCGSAVKTTTTKKAQKMLVGKRWCNFLSNWSNCTGRGLTVTPKFQQRQETSTADPPYQLFLVRPETIQQWRYGTNSVKVVVLVVLTSVLLREPIKVLVRYLFRALQLLLFPFPSLLRWQTCYSITVTNWQTDTEAHAFPSDGEHNITLHQPPTNRQHCPWNHQKDK